MTGVCHHCRLRVPYDALTCPHCGTAEPVDPEEVPTVSLASPHLDALVELTERQAAPQSAQRPTGLLVIGGVTLLACLVFAWSQLRFRLAEEVQPATARPVAPASMPARPAAAPAVPSPAPLRTAAAPLQRDIEVGRRYFLATAPSVAGIPACVTAAAMRQHLDLTREGKTKAASALLQQVGARNHDVADDLKHLIQTQGCTVIASGQRDTPMQMQVEQLDGDLVAGRLFNTWAWFTEQTFWTRKANVTRDQVFSAGR